jgi:dTDP-4-dehydrorhamnose 3,5-epimerase
MDVVRGDINGMLLFTPKPHRDVRGMFTRVFDVEVARSAGLDPLAFRQDSLSRSRAGVVRGLHLRGGRGEAKLVRCSFGAIFDVVVDLRPDSDTYGRCEAFWLDGEAQMSIYIPAGCAHGFQALSDPSDITYRIDRDHDPAEDIAISVHDPQLAIAWPLPITLVSDRDAAAPTLAELGIELPQGSRTSS